MLSLLRNGNAVFEDDFQVELPGVIVYTDLDGRKILVVQNRCELAVEAVRMGCNVDEVTRLLEWREFEMFVSNVFESFGYDVKHDYRFKHRGVRRQVDVLAIQGRRAFSVDCKHWSKTHSLGVYIQKQVERSVLLGEFLSDKEVYPLMVTLGSNGFVDGVPIVASYALRDFLLNLDQYVDMLRVLR
ncbi:hypothetical protein B9Q03_10405 [Candidatus Marsarchaeota G2 archaeon OSP_D]|jgi:hypothetical protein|uniref:NERD domain-containing protein n=2 Tax=Candidatus Marsarchaeota group 2 TaxID=2203771 RepID=A0A2R6B8A9_9ARCH|nr:MAG: hypothetical protein B9Q03_10405 [Candidatus Marsarchaeota G2 archaeon OSP_D]PSN94879.1 MAG: hypothetical protein B9Q09_03730 [Candidatus Marsarchaeota G2 archaeon ECH_B_SAG-C16]